MIEHADADITVHHREDAIESGHQVVYVHTISATFFCAIQRGISLREGSFKARLAVDAGNANTHGERDGSATPDDGGRVKLAAQAFGHRRLPLRIMLRPRPRDRRLDVLCRQLTVQLFAETSIA